MELGLVGRHFMFINVSLFSQRGPQIVYASDPTEHRPYRIPNRDSEQARAPHICIKDKGLTCRFEFKIFVMFKRIWMMREHNQVDSSFQFDVFVRNQSRSLV